MVSESPQLTLRPVTSDDVDHIRSIWEDPKLARRHLCSGVREVHPVEWSTRRRAFGIRLDEELFGSVELHRDEDDPTTWELAVVLSDHKRPLDGARSAVAAMFYAFQALKAGSVWFWVAENNEPIHFFAELLGFTQLNSVKVPGDTPTHIFELNRSTWNQKSRDALKIILTDPVRLNDHERAWIGYAGTFEAAD